MSPSEDHLIRDASPRKLLKIRILSEPFILLYCLTHGIYFTTLPQALLYKSCLGEFNRTLCDPINNKLSRAQQSRVFSATTLWNMTLTVLNVLISLIFILPFGSLSDIISKKKLMLIPPVLRLLQSLIFILDNELETSYILFLMIGASLTALYGDILGALSLGAAYMADGTPDGVERTARMIGLGACSYIGSGIGAFLSGFIANKYGFTYSFILSVSICLLNIVLVVFVLPEETWRQHGEDLYLRDYEEPHENPFHYALKATKHTFVNIYNFAKNYCFKREGTQVWLFILSYFFGILCLDGESAIITLFLKHDPLNLTALAIGEYILLLMAVRGVGGLILFFFVNSIKLKDAYVVSLGCISFIGTYIAMALSSTQTMLFSFSALSIGYPLTLSGLRSCLTKRVRVSEHGTVLSFASFVSLLGSIPMAFTINSLFKYTADVQPGICILFLAGCATLGFILALIAVSLSKCSRRYTVHYESSCSRKKCEESEADPGVVERNPLVSSHEFIKSYTNEDL